jgi:hypothetical protein
MRVAGYVSSLRAFIFALIRPLQHTVDFAYFFSIGCTACCSYSLIQESQCRIRGVSFLFSHGAKRTWYPGEGYSVAKQHRTMISQRTVLTMMLSFSSDGMVVIVL